MIKRVSATNYTKNLSTNYVWYI